MFLENLLASKVAARCRTLLKREELDYKKEAVGPLEVHLLLRQVTLSEKPVELTPESLPCSVLCLCHQV